MQIGAENDDDNLSTINYYYSFWTKTKKNVYPFTFNGYCCLLIWFTFLSINLAFDLWVHPSNQWFPMMMMMMVIN